MCERACAADRRVRLEAMAAKRGHHASPIRLNRATSSFNLLPSERVQLVAGVPGRIRGVLSAADCA
jgi:hypothetical protein